MKNTIPFIYILTFLIAIPIILATQSSDEYLGCLSEKLYKECERGINICEDNIKDGCPNELQPFTNQSIFEWLKNYETKFINYYGITGRLPVLVCKKQDDDYNRLERLDSNKYTLDKTEISCPTIINEGDNITQIGFVNFFTNVNIDIKVKIIFTLSIALNISLIFYLISSKRKSKKRSK